MIGANTTKRMRMASESACLLQPLSVDRDHRALSNVGAEREERGAPGLRRRADDEPQDRTLRPAEDSRESDLSERE